MSNIILNQVIVGDRPMVRYLMKQKGGNVEGKTSPRSAMWMLTNDKAKVPHMTQEFTGFPLTADGAYFFDGCLGKGDDSLSQAKPDSSLGEGAYSLRPAARASSLGEGDFEEVDAAPVCGPDWCEIPELAEKPKRKRAAKKAREGVDE